MARGRRARRFLLFVAVLALAFFLLELNRFFPGTWPGGGGDAGLARRDGATRPDPTRVRPADAPPPPSDPGAPTVTVVVHAADGTALPGAAVEPFGGGRSHPLGPAGASVPAADVRAGLRASAGEARVAHASGLDGARALDVRVPRAPLPPATAATERAVRVVSAATGAPVPGARVAVARAGGAPLDVPVGPDGTGTLPDEPGPFRVRASAPGHADVETLATTRRAGPTTIRLPEKRDVQTSFVDEAGAPLEGVRVATGGGLEGSAAPFAEPPPPVPFAATLDLSKGAWVDVHAPGRPPLRVPTAGLGRTTVVPAGRSVTVRATDEAGAALRNARVVATFAAHATAESSEGPPLRVEATTDAGGRATLVLPSDRPADVVVEAPSLAPTGLRVDAGSTEVEARLGPGVSVPVVVLDAGGAPAAGATASVLARAGASSARRSATTDAAGRADVGPVAAGPAEVYAHAPGSAWASARVDAAPGMRPVELRLAPGVELRLAVSDPAGLPVAGVRVRSVARPEPGGDRPDAISPEDRPWLTGPDGVLVVRDLPDREVDLYLSKPGWHEETLGRVRPGAATVLATLAPAE